MPGLKWKGPLGDKALECRHKRDEESRPANLRYRYVAESISCIIKWVHEKGFKVIT